MNHTLVITALGPDRPGIVRSLAEIVAKHGGSWQESRMARLAGQFAGIVRIDGAAEDIVALHTVLGGQPIEGLMIHTALEEPGAAPATQTIRLLVTGNDRPGIVREISSAIAHAGGNVEDLETRLESAPMTGHPLFTASCVISMPADFDPSGIVHGIERLSSDLTADIED